LPAGERVWLVVDGLGDQATMELNGKPLERARVDVTEMLKERNMLSLSGEGDAFAAYLEIGG